MPATVIGPTPTPAEPEAPPPPAPRVEDNAYHGGSGWYPTGRYRRSYSRGYRRRR